MIDETDHAVQELTARLKRYPQERYPIQHATAQFHLGVVLTNAGRAGAAREALERAVELFDVDTVPVEHAKALNALGAALKADGQARGAAAFFDKAAGLFREAGLALEEGAALYNLALVGDPDRKIATLERVRGLLDPDQVPAQAAAAACEYGTALLSAGDTGGAVGALTDAVSLAERSGHHATLGAAANALGVAHLAEGDFAAAIASFRSAVGAHPRSVRPDGFAMAKANLALTYARAGDLVRARLAAKQALAISEAADAVREQAANVLEEAGEGWGDLIATLDDEPPEARPALLREELVRWVASDESEREAESTAWIEGQLTYPDGTEPAHLWLGALLEQPPEDMDVLVRSIQVVLRRRGADEIERFRSDMSRAMVRFHVPQWERLKETFNRIAVELGDPPAWE